jgi:hypothetical protein
LTPAITAMFGCDPRVRRDQAVQRRMGGLWCRAIRASQALSSAGLFGLVASDPTVSRVIDRLAGDVRRALAAIDTARAAARARAWRVAGSHAPDHDITASRPLIIDVDATLVTAHSTGIGTRS